MFRKSKIRTKIISFIALSLGIIVVLQFFLYSILRKESNNVIHSFLNSVTTSTVMQIDELNSNIVDLSSLISVHPTIQACLYEYSHPEVIRNMSAVQNLLNDYTTSNKNISYLGIIKNNSLFMSSESVGLYDSVREIVSKIESPKNASPIFASSFIFENQTYFVCITPIFPTNVSYATPKHAGNFIICIYKMNSISYAPYEFIEDNQISLIITDKENKIILSSDISDHGKLFNVKEIKKNHLHNTSPISISNWNATIIMPSKSISNFTNMSLFFIIMMIFVTFGILFFLLKLLNDTIIKRIILLKGNVEKISKSDDTYRVHYSYNDEFRDIVDVINSTLTKLHKLNEEKIQTANQLFKAELLQKETRVFYLHGQLSPHFLYNSLSYIQGVAFKYNATEIVHITSSIAKVFRYLSSNLDLSTIGQDLDCATEYFNVINMRRKNPIKLINNIQRELFSVPCLKMIFQPLLENALKHAFTVDDVDGQITISSISDSDNVIIEISDNGCGMSEGTHRKLKESIETSNLDNIQNSEHIGLMNINLRLKLYYGGDCGIKISSSQNNGTVIKVIFHKSPPDVKHLTPHC